MLARKEEPLADRIDGYCDGVIGNNIVGWLNNHDRVNALEPVTVVTDLGHRLYFKATVYRADLAAQLRREEKFGFAIPLWALSNFERTVALFTRKGDLLDNGVVDLAPFKRQPLSRHCAVFLHIPKTAGTSLAAALHAHFGDGATCLYYPGNVTGLDWDMANGLPADQRRAFRLVIGHAGFGLGALLPQPFKYYTFIREPVARLKSHYWHYRTVNKDPATNSGRTIPLHIALNWGLTDEFDNIQTRVIAGAGSEMIPIGAMSEAMLNAALHNIKCAFDFVGLTERLEAHTKIMFAKMGLASAPLPHTNRTPPSLVNVNDEHYRLVDWERVRENNKYDIALYDAVAALWP